MGRGNTASGSAPTRSVFPPSTLQMGQPARQDSQRQQRGSQSRLERAASDRSASADSHDYREESDENDEVDDDEDDDDVTESSHRVLGHHHAGRSGGRGSSTRRRAALRFFSGVGGRPILHLVPPRAVTPLEYLANQPMPQRTRRCRGSDARSGN